MTSLECDIWFILGMASTGWCALWDDFVSILFYAVCIVVCLLRKSSVFVMGW